ncbi:MAG: hypothetical protein H8D67_21385 [Deltaproteobacteria bacterium]|nr:hypothetical protein [Deltaproteobacteria bacterium]
MRTLVLGLATFLIMLNGVFLGASAKTVVDDFNDNSIGEWWSGKYDWLYLDIEDFADHTNKDDCTIEFSEEGGKMKVSGSSGGDGWKGRGLILDMFTLDTCTAQVDVVSIDGAGTGWTMGIFLRQDDTHYILLDTGNMKGTDFVERCATDGGEFQWLDFKIAPTTPLTLKIEYNGKDAKLYLNDKELETFPISLSEFKVGIVGVTRQADDTLEGAFDNFSVSSPEITHGFAVKPSGKLVSTWADIKYGY